MKRAKSREQRAASKEAAGGTSATMERGVRPLVPLGEIDEGVYCQRHVQAQLHGSHAVTMKRLLVGAMQEGARLRDGRLVENNADMLRLLLDRIEDAEGVRLGGGEAGPSEN